MKKDLVFLLGMVIFIVSILAACTNGAPHTRTPWKEQLQYLSQELTTVDPDATLDDVYAEPPILRGGQSLDQTKEGGAMTLLVKFRNLSAGTGVDFEYSDLEMKNGLIKNTFAFSDTQLEEKFIINEPMTSLPNGPFEAYQATFPYIQKYIIQDEYLVPRVRLRHEQSVQQEFGIAVVWQVRWSASPRSGDQDALYWIDPRTGEIIKAEEPVSLVLPK